MIDAAAHKDSGLLALLVEFVRYHWGAATSHEVGWHVEETEPRRPRFGLKESETTRYVQNLKATRSEAALRLLL